MLEGLSGLRDRGGLLVAKDRELAWVSRMIDEEICPKFSACVHCCTGGKISLAYPSRQGRTALRALPWPLAGACGISGHQAKMEV
jgi:hypothetical protein